MFYILFLATEMHCPYIYFLVVLTDFINMNLGEEVWRKIKS